MQIVLVWSVHILRYFFIYNISASSPKQCRGIEFLLLFSQDWKLRTENDKARYILYFFIVNKCHEDGPKLVWCVSSPLNILVPGLSLAPSPILNLFLLIASVFKIRLEIYSFHFRKGWVISQNILSTEGVHCALKGDYFKGQIITHLVL